MAGVIVGVLRESATGERRVAQYSSKLTSTQQVLGAGGHKQSGYGHETGQQTLKNYYQEVKNVLSNHNPKPLGFFA
jgi:acyl-CoA reductase-like NAD-dependent aldehyde dehydrogenase